MTETHSSTKKKYILIDDDPIYQSIMTRVAQQKGIDLDVYESLLALGSIGLLAKYDAVIVDYDLGQINGIEIAEYLSALFGDIPMILVSEKQRDPRSHPWPNCIKQFINKSLGYEYVINQAIEATARQAKKQNPKPHPESSPNKKKTRILVYDDDPIFCKRIKKCEERTNISVLTCTSMDEFCIKALDEEYDIVLLDFYLDTLNGLQAAKITESKPTFLMSHDNAVAKKILSGKNHITGFLSKAHSPNDILRYASRQEKLPHS